MFVAIPSLLTPAPLIIIISCKDLRGDEYNVYATEQLDVHQIICELCQSIVEWTMRRGDTIKFKTFDLSVTNRVWHSFICARLLLVAHTTDVTNEQAILLYVIATRKSIYVGTVISQWIHHIWRGAPLEDLAMDHWSQHYIGQWVLFRALMRSWPIVMALWIEILSWAWEDGITMYLSMMMQR